MTEHAATYKELRRSRDDRMLAGVCGGLARYFDVNPTFYRVGFVVLTLLGGAGVLIYGAALLVMPDEGQRDSIASEVLRDRRHRPWSLAGLALVGVAGIILLSRLSFHIHSGTGFWIVVLIIGAVLLQLQHRTKWNWDWQRHAHVVAAPATNSPPPHTEPAATQPVSAEPATAPAYEPPDYSTFVAESWQHRPRRGSFGITFGVLVVFGGVLGLLAAAGVHIPWTIALAVGAVAIGFGIVSGAVLGRRVGGLAFLGLLLAGAAVFASTVHLHLGGGVGNRTYAPLSMPRPNYRLGIGELDLNLSQVTLAGAQTVVTARVGIGNLRVIVPNDVSVRIIGHAGIGDVNLLGHDSNGGSTDETVSIPGGASKARLIDRTQTSAHRPGAGDTLLGMTATPLTPASPQHRRPRRFRGLRGDRRDTRRRSDARATRLHAASCARGRRGNRPLLRRAPLD